MTTRKKIFVGLLAFAAVGGTAAFFIQPSWGEKVVVVCLVYSAVVSIFLAAQLIGFVASHTNYSETIEAPKFDMLKKERIEWER